MLRIEIPLDGPSNLTFTEIEKYEIPAPPNGFKPEVNDIAIMQFEDEQEAIDYAHDLDEYSSSINSESAEFFAINTIIKAISDDEFVQAYIQS